MPGPPHTTRNRGYLPLWEAEGATYSITFRLADSLPQTVLDSNVRERQGILDTAAQLKRPLTAQENIRLAELFSEKIETALDQGIGECHLRHPQIGQLVFNAIKHFHPARYELFTWCVMPNHVHALLPPQRPTLPRYHPPLLEILHRHRSQQNPKKSQGTFWMPEYYDHLIRDLKDFNHAHEYILNNPKKAKLENWPWIATLK